MINLLIYLSKNWSLNFSCLIGNGSDVELLMEYYAPDGSGFYTNPSWSELVFRNPEQNSVAQHNRVTRSKYY